MESIRDELRGRLSTKQMAEALGVSHDTLQDWRQRRIGPPYHRIVGRVYYLESEVRKWLESNKWR